MFYINTAVVWLFTITIIMMELQPTIVCRKVDDLEAIGYFDEDYATRRKKLDRDTRLLAKKYKSNVKERSMAEDYSYEGIIKTVKTTEGDQTHWTKSRIAFFTFLGGAAFMFLFFLTTLLVMAINEFVVSLEENRGGSSSSMSDFGPPKQQSTPILSSGAGFSQKTSGTAPQCCSEKASGSEKTAKTVNVVTKFTN